MAKKKATSKFKKQTKNEKAVVKERMRGSNTQLAKLAGVGKQG